VSRRDQIKMSEAEAASFLAEERTVTCATTGPRGWPHLMPLWYVLRDPGPEEGLVERSEPPGAAGTRIWAWTYAASQKVRNIERDPRATLQVEEGEAPVQELPRQVAAMVDKQAAKRVALEFVERRRASWDHRKLAGVY